MRFSLRKYIAISIIFTLLVTRVLFFVPYVSAIDLTAPTAPSAPSMPSLDSAPPAAPDISVQIQSPPTAPTVPSFNTETPSTAPPIPTADTVPTSQPAPTQGNVEVLPTSSNFPTPTTGENGSSLTPTGSSSQSSSDSSASGSNTGDGSKSGSSADVNDPANTYTGPGSQNAAYEKLNAEMEQLNKNLAELQNKIDAVTNTGFNYANLNTLDGNVFSGDALTQLNLLNKLNSNMTGTGDFAVFNIYDTYIGDILFKLAGDNVTGSFDSASGTVSKNAVTGPGSTNDAVAENNFKVKEANGNDASIDNDLNLSAVTGNNTASFNTGSGNVTTGDATAVGNIINLANTNLNVSKWLFGVVNIWGTMLGNIILPKDTASTNTTAPVVYTGNTDTGPLSTNNATYTSNNTAGFENVNDAVIVSSIDTSANTGNNTASANTGGGNVSTGDGNVAVSDTTIANTNTNNEEGTVWMIIVNEAGKWVGHILGSDWGTTSASNSLPISQTGSGAGTATFTTLTENAATGPMSENNSSYSENSETTIKNENNAQITNNITANADSGNNEALYNTGAGNIDAGDAKVGLNLVNMANTNVTAKKFVAVLVNVMGEFWGNIVPPQEEAIPVLPTLAPVANTVTPTPVLAQLPGFNEGFGIGGTDVPTIAVSNQAVVDNITYIYDDYYYAQTQAPQQYNQAVNKVNNIKKNISYQKTQLGSQIPTKTYTRGIFLSPAFAKAVESSFPGMLFGGVSLKVDQSWLSVIPLAIFIFIIRRRKKYNISRTIYRFIEAIL